MTEIMPIFEPKRISRTWMICNIQTTATTKSVQANLATPVQKFSHTNPQI